MTRAPYDQEKPCHPLVGHRRASTDLAIGPHWSICGEAAALGRCIHLQAGIESPNGSRLTN